MSKEKKQKQPKQKPENIGSIERRTHNGLVEVRMGEGESESRTVRGYAAVFNQESEIMSWGFVEVIATGAFDEVLGDDVRALLNHDANIILARTGATLEIGVDETGLWYEFEAPNTTAGNDLVENIRLGNINQSSFGFTVEKATWTEDNKDNYIKEIRTIEKVKKLYDVSPVTYPAYQMTEVSLRSLEEFRNKEDQPDTSNDPQKPEGKPPVPFDWRRRSA